MEINFDRATKRRYSIESVAPNRFYLTFAERNSRGEQITIGFTRRNAPREPRGFGGGMAQSRKHARPARVVLER